MHILGKFLRIISLSLLSGGSTAIVFAAIVLVKAAIASGVPVAEAATNNAPVFIQYSKVALAAAIMLGIAELIEFRQIVPKSKLDLWRSGASLACIASIGLFAFGIVPSMEQLLPDIKTLSEAHEKFNQLHQISRSVFGASILFAFVSLLLPVFKKDNAVRPAMAESKVLL